MVKSEKCALGKSDLAQPRPMEPTELISGGEMVFWVYGDPKRTFHLSLFTFYLSRLRFWILGSPPV